MEHIIHPSINIKAVNNENIYIEFNKECCIELEKLKSNFLLKYGTMKNAETKYSTNDLIFFLKSFDCPNLDKFFNNISNILCNKIGFCVIKSLPLDNHEDISLFIISSLLGLPQYNNRDRKYIWPIISKQIDSTKSLEGNIRYGNTGIALPYHTDTATVAGLFCLSPSYTGGENKLISTALVHNTILEKNPDLLNQLYNEFYIDRRGEELDGMLPYSQLPVFANRNGNLLTFWADIYNYDAYKKYNIKPLTNTQLEAYDILKDTINEISLNNSVNIRLNKGELLLMNNNLLFHSRSSFVENQEFSRKYYRMWVNIDKYPTFPHMFGY